MSKLAYRRILLKLSGEALMGDEDYGIDPVVIGRIAREVMETREAGAEVRQESREAGQNIKEGASDAATATGRAVERAGEKMQDAAK